MTLADRRWIGWAIAAVALVVFGPTLVFHQVGYDDQWLWSEASPLRTLDADALRHVFFELDARTRHDLGTEYLPVRDLVVAGDMALWGANEQGPHLTHVVLYALTIAGLGSLLVQFGMRRDLAWLATLLWALHPLHVETVAWLSERKGVLAGLSIVVTGHAWVRYRAGGAARWLVFATGAAIAATWSKAPAMFAPAIFAVWDLLLIADARRRWRTIVVVNAAAVLAAVPVVLVAFGGGIVDGEVKVPPDGRMTAAIGSLGHYVAGFVLARTPSISYPIQTTGATALDLSLGATAIAGGVALALWRGSGRPWRLATLAWATLTFMPIGHLLARVHITAADRYVYLWSLAPCIGVASLLLRLTGWRRTLGIGAVTLVLAVASIRAEGAWVSSYELFSNALRENPGDSGPAEALAVLLFTRGEPEEALGVIDTALRHVPGNPYLLSRRAALLDHLRRDREALEAARRAAESGHASTLSQYAGLLAKQGALAEAAVAAERAVRRRPEVPDYAWRYIEILVTEGRFDDATREAEALVVRHPSSASHLVFARVLDARGDRAAAEVQRVIAEVVYGARRPS